MPIDYDQLMAARAVDQPFEYDEARAILYALGIGFGADPTNPKELPYVYEGAALRTVPSMATMLASIDFLDDCGWNYDRLLHGEERLELYRPLPPAARLLANSRVTAAYDRGTDKGAVIIVQTDVRLAKDDTALFTLGSTLLARADGGFGGPKAPTLPAHRLPRREPDLVCELPTRRDQALLFRLSGDFSPLHADPKLAKQLGFSAPILHGRCTYGIACRAILQTICDYDFTLITGFDARFSAPVLPGDTLATHMWQDGNIVSFRCVAKARNSVVINHGKCTLAT